MNGDVEQRLCQLTASIAQSVVPEVLDRYMSLARRWFCGKLRMDQFDRKGSRLVPMKLHTDFILKFGDTFDIPFESEESRLIKRPSRKRRGSSSETSKVTPNPGSSHFETTSATSSLATSASYSSSLSQRIMFFIAANEFTLPNSLGSAKTAQQRVQELTNDIMFYACLSKTPHIINEAGFVTLQRKIDPATITESDVIEALQKHHFLLNESSRNLLIAELTKPKRPKHRRVQYTEAILPPAKSVENPLDNWFDNHTLNDLS